MNWEKRRIIAKIGSGCLALWAAIWHAPPFYAQGLKPITIRALFNREKGFIMKNGYRRRRCWRRVRVQHRRKRLSTKNRPSARPIPLRCFACNKAANRLSARMRAATNTACACSPTARKCMNGRCSAGITNNAQGSLKTGEAGFRLPYIWHNPAIVHTGCKPCRFLLLTICYTSAICSPAWRWRCCFRSLIC